MAKRPVPLYDFRAFPGKRIKAWADSEKGKSQRCKRRNEYFSALPYQY